MAQIRLQFLNVHAQVWKRPAIHINCVHLQLDSQMALHTCILTRYMTSDATNAWAINEDKYSCQIQLMQGSKKYSIFFEILLREVVEYL